MKTDKDKEAIYHRTTNFKIISKEEQERKKYELNINRINNNAMRYLSIFIKYVREIQFIFNESVLKITPGDKECAPYYDIVTSDGKIDYSNIAYVVAGDIFNEQVWKYIIEHHLNNDTINELRELLTTKINMPPYMKNRIDQNGIKRFINDVQNYNPEMKNEIEQMFNDIDIIY
jgi:hypothetical protein